MNNCLLCGNQIRIPIHFTNLFGATTESWLCTLCRSGFLSVEGERNERREAIFKWNEQAENFVDRYLKMQDDELAKCFCADVRKKVRPKLAYLALTDATKQILIAASVPCVTLDELPKQTKIGVFLMQVAEETKLSRLECVSSKIVHVLSLFEEEVNDE